MMDRRLHAAIRSADAQLADGRVHNYESRHDRQRPSIPSCATDTFHPAQFEASQPQGDALEMQCPDALGAARFDAQGMQPLDRDLSAPGFGVCIGTHRKWATDSMRRARNAKLGRYNSSPRMRPILSSMRAKIWLSSVRSSWNSSTGMRSSTRSNSSAFS